MTARRPGFAQPELDRRKFAIGLAFACTAGLAAARQPNIGIDRLGAGKLEEVIPKAVGAWRYVGNSGLVVPPNDQLSQALYSQLLTRVYSDGRNPPVMLLVAHSGEETGFLQIHRPEVCYQAGGYKVFPVSRQPLRLSTGALSTNSLVAKSDSVVEHVLYWIRIGEHLTASWGQQRLAAAWDNLRGIVPDAALVRVSTVSNDSQAAFQTMDAFVKAVIEAVPPGYRSVLVPELQSPRG